MATQEKLQRSLEALKNLSSLPHSPDPIRKKEKIHHCHIVTEAFSNSTIKVSTKFQVLLNFTIDTFLQLCDDPESDIRMTSDECLNRIIRTVSAEHIAKVLIILHKEISKNGSARSLRAALVRFSQLAHHIKPHKGKVYVINFFPSIIRITKRTEEPIHETLANCLPKIINVLGPFATDADIELLLKAFLNNINNSSPTVRRAASNCILSICINSRKPYIFVTYCVNILLGLIIPVDDTHDNYVILGVLYSLKLLLPALIDSNINNDGFSYSKDIEIIQPLALSKFLQIYELCLFYIRNKDHNIINASLETLNVLLSNITADLKNKLLSPSGVDKCRIHKSQSFNNIKSPSQLSIATNTTSAEETLFSECDLTETIESDIGKWIGESKLSVINMPHGNAADEDIIEPVMTSNEDNIAASSCENNVRKEQNKFGIELRKIGNADTIDKLSNKSSEESITASESVDKLLDHDLDNQEVDIGKYLDKNVSLSYCARLIIKSFLLCGVAGKCISDKTVRVSVKSSALCCLSSIFRLYPQVFFQYLNKNGTNDSKSQLSKISHQKISDILLFSEHSDPQLRGNIRMIVSDLISAILLESNLDFDLWIKNNINQRNIPKDGTCYHMTDFIAILSKGLQDENSNCLKQTLISLNPVLMLLAESKNCHDILSLLDTLPYLANNPYWLVKVSLCELVSKLSYVTLFHITENSIFQSKVLYNILFLFLKDSDQRIRSAASASLTEIIENLYFEEYHPMESHVTTKAILINNKLGFKNSTGEMNLQRKQFIESMPFPYLKIGGSISKSIDYSLSKIVMHLYSTVLSTQSKYLIYGGIEALSLLSNKYPCTIYRKSWCDSKHFKDNDVEVSMTYSSEDLFTLCVDYLTNSIYVYDIAFMNNLMNLSANLYAGHATLLLKPVDVLETGNQTWSMIPGSSIKPLSEQYLLHTVKLLNIFHNVINDLVPIVPQSKTVLPHLPSTGTLSPIKRRKSDERKIPIAPGKIVMEREEKKEYIKSALVGFFGGSQHYMKIFDILRGAFINYKSSLDPKDSKNLIDLLQKTLQTLSVILEVTTLSEFGRISEEVLTYLQSTFLLDSILTVRCVQQLLKCLFGSNLTSNVTDILDENLKKKESNNFSFYHNIFQKPCEEILICVNSLKSISKIECDGDSTIMGYLHRRDIKKPISITRTSDKILASYLKIFEPIVIKSLEEYIITSNVKFQCSVLQLLSQLVQLRVNYCLFDSDQVFKNFVLKQVEYIEAGQVPHSEELTPRIFKFLVHLSYSKQHSRNIISIPEIIQLCDGLMASGQDPKTHYIPALEPIVQDVFLIRNRSNTTDVKELETTREVILSMLLRLLEYREVIKLVTLVLEDSKYCIDDTDKWYRWSNQVVVVFLQMLKQNRIKIENKETFAALRKFIFALNPNVFKPCDDLIIMLFQAPPSSEDTAMLRRWISKVILLLLILSPLKEDVLISKINNLKDEFSPGCIHENFIATADPLNVHNNADAFQNVFGEDIIARMFFRVITFTTKHVMELCKNNSNLFLVSQFSVFLMYCLHVFQSGSLCKVSQIAISLLNEKNSNDVDINILNQRFIEIGKWYPTVTFQWCHILSVLHYNELQFWTNMITTKGHGPINNCIVNVGNTIVFCDYLNENISETKQLSWNLSENSENLINLIGEVPVSEFITFIHRNATLSRLFIHSIDQKYLDVKTAIFKIKVLKCLENSHSSQTGAVIKLLIPKMLSNRQIAISRMVGNLASRKVEYLFTLPLEEVHCQLSKDDLFIIKEELNLMNLSKKYETLISLFNKLLIQYYDMSPLDFNRSRMINHEYIKKQQINKKWLLSQIQNKYQDGALRKENAKVMAKLEYTELISFMSSEDFNKLIFRDCFEIGMQIVRDHQLKQEPPILKASIDCVLREIAVITNDICSNHEVFKMSATEQQNSYTKKILQSFKDEKFFNSVLNINLSLAVLMKALESLPTIQLSEIDSENISKFAVVSLEFIGFIIDVDNKYINVSSLDIFINTSNEILKQSQFSSYLGLDSNISWLCSSINVLHYFLGYLLRHEEPLPSSESIMLSITSDNIEVNQAMESSHNLYILVQWLYSYQRSTMKIPRFLLEPIKSLIVSLARLPLVNSYNLIPSRVWKLGWQPVLSGKFSTQVPPLPIEMLQEVDVLEEYIFRVILLGWMSRQQFEETWMCFLSVLCSNLDSPDSADINSVLQASSLSIKAFTALLMQTLRYPVLGNNNISEMIHVSRNVPIQGAALSVTKLMAVQNLIEHKFTELSPQTKTSKIRNVFSQKNFEKSSNQYSYGQMSIKYFLICTSPEKQSKNCFAETVLNNRTRSLEEYGLDINSCLQFLLEYYTPLMKNENTGLRILHETVRSTLFISDLFTDKSQFDWMLVMFLELAKTHAVEDELIHQYLLVGICKCVGVLSPDLEIYEQTKKLLVQFLKSPFTSTRISCLYGLLYILEGCILNNSKIAGISEELQLILPCAVEYVLQHFNTQNPVLRGCQEHTLLVWSVAFYLIENVDDIHMEKNFVINMLQSAFTMLKNKMASDDLEVEIIKSLERLLLVRPMYILERFGKSIQKLALEKLKDENPLDSILGVQLLITYMYVDCWEHLERPEADNEQTSPDHLVQTIEKLSAIFERIKRSYAIEVEVLCSVLPLILKDFFSPSDILTKVIGEFLSPQQPHLKLMSGVVFQVFETAIEQCQLSLLQDWVVFSLANFTQSFSNTANTWCLTCFFISASSSEWLRSYFPYVQNRVGRYEYEDKKIFCIAGVDFYRNLTNDKQRQAFVDSFVKVKDQLEMPFSDLLNSL
ncbi:huntingtin isoform X2 [Rhynchophorus ferrugineus]|uniref:huntingtin isoform X2 n=1 Tax=Rhynchophorus ferrugineus TaxID=354439 RepID=UPI003FCCEDCD